MATNFQQRLLDGVLDLLAPIEEAATDPDAMEDLFLDLGWVTDPDIGFPEGPLLTAVADAGAAITGLRTTLANEPKTFGDLQAAFDAVGAAIKAVQKLADLVQQGAPSDFADVARQLLNSLLVNQLRQRHPVLYQTFRLLTIIHDVQTSRLLTSSGEVQRGQVVVQELDFGKIVALVTDPLGTLKKEYLLTNGLDNPNGTADLLFPRIAALLNAMRVDAVYGVDPQQTIDLGSVGNDLAAHTLTLSKSFVTIVADTDEAAGFGLSLLLDDVLGVIVRPFGVLTLSEAIGHWLASATLSASAGFAVSRDGVRFSGSDTAASLALRLTRTPFNADETADGTGFHLGSSEGTRLDIPGFAVEVNADFGAGKRDFGFTIDTGKSKLVVKGGEGDGLIAKVLPKETTIDFRLRGGWSEQRGLHFDGSATLEVALPVNLSIADVLTIDVIHLLLGVVDGALRADVAADITVTLGPVEAAIEGLGVSATVTFPPGGGNLGPAEASVGFRLPNGVGIAINSGPVSGGGFLKLEPEIGRYSGAVALRVYEIGVQAFGIIETKFPDGRGGFSFIIIISAEFAPIQLGLGFTLLGVGGLLGINRSVNEDGLEDAVRRGTLENILFPHDVIGDAPSILHDVETIFPPTEGHYIFGPMAKIGWSTPAIVEAQLGVLLELPGPRLVILGTAAVIFPPGQTDPDDKLVEIHVDVDGLLDFPKKHFALDAHLHDSQVVGFPLSGDMAVRMDWGDNPNFAIAIGGFHPHFTPPAGFPKLRRITLDLGINGNPSATVTGYMAVTSNSAQVGARLDAHASADGATLSGTIGFDALFIFSPFSFVATFDASVSVDFADITFNLSMYGEVSGPSPWRIKGSVHVGVWFASATVPVSITVGGERKVELPPLDPWEGAGDDVPGLRKAIEATGNWSGTLPAGGYQAVSTATVSDRSLVDPLGVATFQQKVLPLNFVISRFGGRKPTHNPPDAAAVAALTVNGVDVKARMKTVQDFFAPGQYKQMADSESLSSKSYQRLDGGFQFSSDDIDVSTVVPQTLTYTTVVIGAPVVPAHPTPSTFSPTADQVTSMVQRGATGFGGVRNAGTNRFVDLATPVAFTLRDEVFAIASKAGLIRVNGDTDGAYAVKATALAALPPDVRATLQVVPLHELAS